MGAMPALVVGLRAGSLLDYQPFPPGQVRADTPRQSGHEQHDPQPQHQPRRYDVGEDVEREVRHRVDVCVDHIDQDHEGNYREDGLPGAHPAAQEQEPEGARVRDDVGYEHAQHSYSARIEESVHRGDAAYALSHEGNYRDHHDDYQGVGGGSGAIRRLAQAAREEAVTAEGEEHARARGSGAKGAGEGTDHHTEVYGVGHDRPDVAP